MVLSLVTLALVLLPVAAVDLQASGGAALSFDMEAATAQPVDKVVALLKDMLKELEKEGEEDQETYDKVSCWCTTNRKIKEEDIKKGKDKKSDLEQKVKEYTAIVVRLTVEIEKLTVEMSSYQAALFKALTIREKQQAEFHAEEKDLIESINALHGAIVVLSKHHTSLLQMPSSHLMGVAASLQHQMQKHGSVLAGVLTHTEKRALASFLQSPQDYLAAPTFKAQYNAQSGQIFGILQQMKETFEQNLAAIQKEEAANLQAYLELKEAKEAELVTVKVMLQKKRMEFAVTTESNAQAGQDLEDTNDSLEADEAYLATLIETCANTDKEWEDRQKTRALEMEAVSKALAILSADGAVKQFEKTLTFLQEDSKNSKSRAEVSKLLSQAAEKTHSSALARLALTVRLDAFTTVKKAIDDMILQLKVEKQVEIKQKDLCVKEFGENELKTQDEQRSKAEAEATIESLEGTIAELSTAIKSLNAELDEMKLQKRRADEDRQKENQDFQFTIADQKATQKLLVKALKVLEGFYKREEAALMQHGSEPAGPPPPPGFKEWKDNGKSGGVMGLLQAIIDDSKSMENKAIAAEADAQKAYESYVKETNVAMGLKEKELMNKSGFKAEAEVSLVEAKDKLSAAVSELESLSKEKGDLHAQCDFLMKNFDIRQEARDEEVEALKSAKAILSGAKFEAFLQQ